MASDIFLVEYASYGGRALNGEDDAHGASPPQIPGEIVNYQELASIDASTGGTITLNPRTTFVKYMAYTADAYCAFDGADASVVASGNRERISPGQVHYQGVVDSRTGVQRYSKVHFKAVS